MESAGSIDDNAHARRSSSPNHARILALSVRVVGMVGKNNRTLVFAAAWGIGLTGWITGVPQAAADDSVCTTVGQYCGFYSPTHNIDCEINTGGRVGQDGVYCKTGDPAQSVQMDNKGAFQTCAGPTCLGDPPLGIPDLAYGQTMALGPFKCLSEESGVTCTAAGGRGFTISTKGVATVG
ncbi:hypothetical protein FHT40_001018 [Mycolicibacterium sp. BK556]|uniref:hypothetical protein n=1 Tax=unclassified Mycolicibacterium TaxID=2636767 RepID=UPI00160CA9E1|nr:MULTISPECIES: hypothetical protein [unclassified Mycolicibacterium]MBB3601385.1 hypothetical protein [Mycolicibacterium sp. BK556]MBB3631137.1 hypothetical protein [Mycolicibacterium sp. BK607]